MNIGILGTGNLATTPRHAWASAGHTLLVTGRDPDKARAAADRIGPSAKVIGPVDFPAESDVVVLTVSWAGVEQALSLVAGPAGSLRGKTVIDPTNPVDYATGNLIPASGSAAGLIARAAEGAHVVKALHLFAGASWPYTGPRETAPVVAVCGDQPTALDLVTTLIGDVGGLTAVVGGLAVARQLEEAAGFVMKIVAAGSNPRFAVPDVGPALIPVPEDEHAPV